MRWITRTSSFGRCGVGEGPCLALMQTINVAGALMIGLVASVVVMCVA